MHLHFSTLFLLVSSRPFWARCRLVPPIVHGLQASSRGSGLPDPDAGGVLLAGGSVPSCDVCRVSESTGQGVRVSGCQGVRVGGVNGGKRAMTGKRK